MKLPEFYTYKRIRKGWLGYHKYAVLFQDTEIAKVTCRRAFMADMARLLNAAYNFGYGLTHKPL